MLPPTSAKDVPPRARRSALLAIAVRGLTKRFGAVTAVDDLTFEVRPGCVTGFLGPNGAGKSTTMRMVLGLVRPTGGSATVLGLPHASLDRPASAVGAVLEVQSFHPLRTGRNHLRVLAAASGLPVARVDEVLEIVDLASAARRKAGYRWACASGCLSPEPCSAIRGCSCSTSRPTASTRKASVAA